MPKFFRLPVVSLGAEYLVMGYLMRRNILTYKAPPNHEGYDLIAIHPDPKHKPRGQQLPQVRIQVKSRITTRPTGFLVKEKSLGAFDYLVVAILNLGNFSRRGDGSDGEEAPTFLTLPRAFVKRHLDTSTNWHKVVFARVTEDLEEYRDARGFEQIAKSLGVRKPRKTSSV